jgi:hypothetical protein
MKYLKINNEFFEVLEFCYNEDKVGVQLKCLSAITNRDYRKFKKEYFYEVDIYEYSNAEEITLEQYKIMIQFLVFNIWRIAAIKDNGDVFLLTKEQTSSRNAFVVHFLNGDIVDFYKIYSVIKSYCHFTKI